MFRFLRISDTTTETASDAVQIVFGLDPGYRKYVLTADAHRILELAAANEIGAAVDLAVHPRRMGGTRQRARRLSVSPC